MAKNLDFGFEVHEFELQLHNYIHFRNGTLWKDMNVLKKISLLLFYEDILSIKSFTNVNKPLNKVTNPISISSLRALDSRDSERERERESEGNPCCQHQLMTMIMKMIDKMNKPN